MHNTTENINNTTDNSRGDRVKYLSDHQANLRKLLRHCAATICDGQGLNDNNDNDNDTTTTTTTTATTSLRGQKRCKLTTTLSHASSFTGVARSNWSAVRCPMVGRYAPLGFQKSLKPRDTLHTSSRRHTYETSLPSNTRK